MELLISQELYKLKSKNKGFKFQYGATNMKSKQFTTKV